MAQIKLMRGTGLTNTNPKIKDGQLLFATDTKAIYLDVDGSTRIKLYDSLDTALTDIDALEAKLAGLKEATVVAKIAAEIAKLKKEVVAEAEDSNSVTLTIADNAGATAKKIKAEVKISSETDNHLSLKTDAGKEGLYVPAPAAADTYEIEQVADSDVDKTQYAAAYKLVKKTRGTGTGTQVGATINIIKDNFIDKVTLVDTDGTNTGKFIKITFKDTNTSTIYLDVKDLFNVYKGAAAADGIITVAVDATTGVITATIADGTITKAKLETAVQTSLGLANTAVQPTKLAKPVVANEYISGIEVADNGTIDIKKATLPSLDSLEWGSFGSVTP